MSGCGGDGIEVAAAMGGRVVGKLGGSCVDANNVILSHIYRFRLSY